MSPDKEQAVFVVLHNKKIFLFFWVFSVYVMLNIFAGQVMLLIVMILFLNGMVWVGRKTPIRGRK